MATIRGHFDGKVVVPDEPVDWVKGQAVIVQAQVAVDAATDEEDALAWTQGIAHEWTSELSDPREDVYTMDDGEPIHGAK